MRTLDRKFLGVALAAATLLLAPSASASAADDVKQKEKIKVVDVTIKGAGQEDPPATVPIGPQKRNFRSKLLLLRQIAADDAIAGVRLKIKGSPDYARSLDLMRELRRVKQAGKKVVCYSETLDQRGLVFASLADVLALPPSGAMVLEGLLIEAMYMKDLLAMIDAEVEVVHIGNFKTAYEDLARDSMSAEQRKVLQILLDEFYGQMQQEIAVNRGITVDAVEAMYEKLIVKPEEAKQAGLISMVGYRDEFDKRCEELLGGEIEYDKKYGEEGMEELEKMLESPFAMFSLLPKLLNPPKKKLLAEPRIAIVYATGPIMSGKSQMGFDGTISSMGSDTIVKALETALEDDWVKAVILRVNSPGGSAIASDMIWRATQRVKAKKPIISSMGSVAASGGYWISMGCDRILAQPSTITGSIGVVGMLPNLSGTMKKIGINVEAVGAGPHWQDLAMLRNGPSPVLREMVRKSMLDVYDEFIRKVSEGRRMNPQVLETLARGRVWTGRQALDLNLVDGLGGIEEAIHAACELGGGLDPDTTAIVEYPEAPNFLEQLEESFEDLITVRGQMRRLMVEFGYGDLVSLAESLVDTNGRIGPENVKVVLPFAIRIR